MNNITYIKEYNTFMEWFKKKRPEMYGRYWTNIVMPLDQSGVGVNGNQIDDEHYEQLVELIYNYYKKRKNNPDR